MKRHLCLCLPSVLALLAGCSSYSGQKLGLDASTKQEVPTTGLPYRLVRPEFALSFAPPAAGETEPTFTVKVSYEPDPNQFYSLRVTPGLFADPDFTLMFGAGGTLTSSKAGFTEQLTPAIKGIGSFAANLAALGVFDEASLRSQLVQAIDSANCTGSSGVARLDRSSLRLERPDVPNALKDRLAKLDKSDVIRSRFHYLSEAERACLERARNNLKNPFQNAIQAARASYDAIAPNHPAEDKTFADDVTRVLDTNNQERFALLQRDQAALNATNKPLHDRRKPLVDAAALVMLAQKPNETIETLDLIVGMNDATWRARHLLYLEDEISGSTLALQRHPAASTRTRGLVLAHIAELERSLADTIGATDLFVRRQRLRALLDRASMAGRGAASSAEYSVARTELDLLNERIAAQRAKIVAAATAPAPRAALAFRDVPAMRVSAADIASSNLAGWDRKIHREAGDAGVPAPRFAIVLEPLP